MSAAREHVGADLAAHEEREERLERAANRARREALEEFAADPVSAIDLVVDEESRSTADSVARMRHEAMDALDALIAAHREVPEAAQSATDRALVALLRQWGARYLAVRLEQDAGYERRASDRVRRAPAEPVEQSVADPAEALADALERFNGAGAHAMSATLLSSDELLVEQLCPASEEHLPCAYVYRAERSAESDAALAERMIETLEALAAGEPPPADPDEHVHRAIEERRSPVSTPVRLNLLRRRLGAAALEHPPHHRRAG